MEILEIYSYISEAFISHQNYLKTVRCKDGCWILYLKNMMVNQTLKPCDLQ